MDTDKQITCYYAHPMNFYGSEQEQRDIKLLEGMYLKVLNPNTPEHQEAGTGNIDYFIALAIKCDMIAFRALPDGKLSLGVAAEIEACKHLPTIELPSAILGRC